MGLLRFGTIGGNMFRLLMALLLCAAVMLGIMTAVMAQSRSVEYIWNAVWSSSTSTIKIIGQ